MRHRKGYAVPRPVHVAALSRARQPYRAGLCLGFLGPRRPPGPKANLGSWVLVGVLGLGLRPRIVSSRATQTSVVVGLLGIFAGEWGSCVLLCERLLQRAPRPQSVAIRGVQHENPFYSHPCDSLRG